MRLRHLILLLVALSLLFAGCEPKANQETKKENTAEAAKKDDGKKAEGSGEAAKEEPVKEKAADELAKVDEVKADEVKVDDTAAVADDAVVAAVVAAPGDGNPFLNLIPSDTPYYWGSVSTVPMEKLPFNMEEWGSFYSGLAEQVQKDDPNGVGKLLGVILQEFDGKLSKEGLESLGISTESYVSLYGIGAFPVMRFTLLSGSAFEAVVARIEEKAGLQVEKKTMGDVTYRQWSFEGVTVVAAILNNELAVAAAPDKAVDWMLPYVFGQKSFDKSLAGSGILEKLAADYEGKEGVSVGFVDIAGLYAAISGDTKNLVTESLEVSGIGLPPMSADCKGEFASLVNAVPRLTYGGVFDGDAMRMSLNLEITNPAFVLALKSLVSSVPGMGSDPGPVFGVFGAALDVKQSIGWATGLATAIASSPFKCEGLEFLNEAARGVAPLADPRAIPPFVTGLKGFYIVVEELAFSMETGPSNIKAKAVLRTDSPQELWAQVTPLAGPMLKGVNVKPDGEPVAIPAIPEAPFIKEPAVVMTDKSIGISIGEGGASGLNAFANAEAPADSPMLRFGYDYGKMFGTMFKDMPANDAMDLGMIESMVKAYKAFGMATMDLAVTDKGLQFNYTLAFAKK